MTRWKMKDGRQPITGHDRGPGGRSHGLFQYQFTVKNTNTPISIVVRSRKSVGDLIILFLDTSTLLVAVMTAFKEIR